MAQLNSHSTAFVKKKNPDCKELQEKKTRPDRNGVRWSPVSLMKAEIKS